MVVYSVVEKVAKALQAQKVVRLAEEVMVMKSVKVMNAPLVVTAAMMARIPIVAWTAMAASANAPSMGLVHVQLVEVRSEEEKGVDFFSQPHCRLIVSAHNAAWQFLKLGGKCRYWWWRWWWRP
jgi:hypothetical protein